MGKITDIQRASVHDGPGFRTTVFFKGCPLSCKWCHNPECIAFEPQVLYYPEKCIGCGQCAKGCFSGAKVVCGKEMTAEEVLKEVLLDRAYYAGGGGVTLSGGEPLAQPEFAAAILEGLQAEGIHRAMETSLYRYLPEVLTKLDLLMADLKIWDDEIHKTYTGVGNRAIKENLIRADALGIPIIVRTPVVPGVEQGIPEIAAFLKNFNHVIKYELLPYHPLGVPKQQALGLPATEFEAPTAQQMEELNQYADLRR